jgi:hypothetical protein
MPRIRLRRTPRPKRTPLVAFAVVVAFSATAAESAIAFDQFGIKMSAPPTVHAAAGNGSFFYTAGPTTADATVTYTFLGYFSSKVGYQGLTPSGGGFTVSLKAGKTARRKVTLSTKAHNKLVKDGKLYVKVQAYGKSTTGALGGNEERFKLLPARKKT